MRSLSHMPWWVTMCFIPLGCSLDPELPIEYETEHLRIGSELDEPLCNGDLVRYEQMISTIEGELMLDMTEQATVYLYTEETWWSGTNEVCGDDTLGCYSVNKHTIFAVMRSLEHEIVHAVAGENMVGEFFDQAIAEIYSENQTQFGRTAPSASIDLSGKIVDHYSANHFVRWLRERWGGERLGEILHEDGSGSEAFEKVYGMAVSEAEELYFEEAPYQYSSLYSCDGLSLSPVQPDQSKWREEIALDCPAGDDTRTSGIGMIVHRTFDVPEPGYYTIHHDGYWFDIYRCSPERIEEGVPPARYLHEDVPPEHGGFPSGAYRHYEGQTTWDLYMEAGKHDIGVGLLGHETGTVTLEISPTLGPHPLPPN